MNGWVLALLGLGGAVLYLATRPKPMDATMPGPASNYVPMPVPVSIMRTPAWAMTPAGQAWVVANEQNNVVNPPGTPAWYAWQAAHPAPTNLAPSGAISL